MGHALRRAAAMRRLGGWCFGLVGLVLGAQSCDGTYFLTDRGRIFVPRGQTVRVTIQGKPYLCTGCAGCTEDREAVSNGRPLEGVERRPVFDAAGWEREYREGLPAFSAQTSAYRKDREAAREAEERAFQREGLPALKTLIEGFPLVAPAGREARNTQYRQAHCDAWKALRAVRQQRAMLEAGGSPEALRERASIGFDTPGEPCSPGGVEFPWDRTDPAWIELEGRLDRLKALGRQAVELLPRLERAQQAKAALDQRLAALEQRYGRTLLTQIFGLAPDRSPKASEPPAHPPRTKREKPPKLNPAAQADLEALAAQVDAQEREVQALEARLDALEMEWKALDGSVRPTGGQP